jgi:hypothetical protein
MEKCAEHARSYYQASGDTFKHVGVLRAADIYWNKERSVDFYLFSKIQQEASNA